MSENKPKTLLVVGNGYDLACNYATHYKDFIASNDFNTLIKNSNNLCRYIKGKIKIQGWADVEEELYNYSIYITQRYGANNNEQMIIFKSEYNQLRLALQNYISSLNTTKDGHEHNSFVNKLSSIWCYKSDIIKIIDFNYSATLWLNINKYLTDSKLYQKVHGLVSLGYQYTENKIVLGIDETMKVEDAHSFLYKSYDNNCNVANINSAISNAERYIIFGCSFGKTDEWYFSKILNQKNKEYHIYIKDGSDNIKNRIGDIYGKYADFKSENQIYFYDTNNEIVVLNETKEHF